MSLYYEYLRYILQRMFREETTTVFAFKPGGGTTDAIFVVSQLIEKRRECLSESTASGVLEMHEREGGVRRVGPM